MTGIDILKPGGDVAMRAPERRSVIVDLAMYDSVTVPQDSKIGSEDAQDPLALDAELLLPRLRQGIRALAPLRRPE